MYGCESWTIKKAEHRRIDAFELWCWRRLLRVLWTARRFNQPILKEISPEYSLERLMLKLKLQYLATWCKELIWKDPDSGKDWRREEKGTTEDEMLGGIIDWWPWVWASSRSWWWTGRPGMLQSMGSHRVGNYWVTEQNWIFSLIFFLHRKVTYMFELFALIFRGDWSFAPFLTFSVSGWLVSIGRSQFLQILSSPAQSFSNSFQGIFNVWYLIFHF